MAFESIKAEIDLLLAAMINQPEDAREIHEQVREKLNELRAVGMPLPADLVALEAQMDRDEAGDPDIEQAGLAPLQIEPEADQCVGKRGGEEEGEIAHYIEHWRVSDARIFFTVIPALGAGIHALDLEERKAWIPGPSPGMKVGVWIANETT